MAKTRVVVTGRNYCNILTMTRALGEAGYDVEVLRVYKMKPSRVNLLHQMKPDAHSKYVKEFHECIAHNNPEIVMKALIKMASKSKGEKKLLVPVDDYLACVVDNYLEELKDLFILPNIADKPGEISRLMDKNEQKKLAEAFDLPMLFGTLIKSENGRFEIPKEMVYPCFIKPNVSMNSTKAKMAKCENREELQKTLEKYALKEDFEMLVEEFADIKAEYSILGVSIKEQVIAPGIFKVIEGGHRERKGVTIIGESVDSSRFQKMIEECVRYIGSLNYTGLFDVDLIETKDGKVYFIELNFRAGASTHLFTKMGINLPGMYADYLVKGKNLDCDVSVKDSGIRFVSEKVLMEEFARSDADIATVRKYMAEADVCFIKDNADPKPHQNFSKYYLYAALMRIPYRLRDKGKRV